MTIEYVGTRVTSGGWLHEWTYYCFLPFEIERRRFLNDHHHLIQPSFYSDAERMRRDRLAMVERFMRAGAAIVIR